MFVIEASRVKNREICRETRNDCYVPSNKLAQYIPRRKVHMDVKETTVWCKHPTKITTRWLVSWFMENAASSIVSVFDLQHCSCKSHTFRQVWSYAVEHRQKLSLCHVWLCFLAVCSEQIQTCPDFCFWCWDLLTPKNSDWCIQR